MRIEHLTDKGSGPVNEDSYLIIPNLYGVFDGQTGLIKYADINGNTVGLIASQTAKEVFKKNQNEPLIASAEKILIDLKGKMIAAGINMKDKADFWSTCASVVKITDTSLEYLQIGDNPIVLAYKDGSIQLLMTEHDTENLIMWKKIAKEGVKDIRNDKRMQEQLLKNRRETNVTYGILNGEKEAIKFVKTGDVPKEKIKYVLIFTDGMLIPKQDPDEPENLSIIIELFEEGGLEKIKSYIRDLENSDPDCIKYLRFKPHDDLTAIAINF